MFNTLLAQISAPEGVSGFLDSLDGDQRFVVGLVVIGCVTAVLITLGSVISASWCSVREKQIEADLKRDMLDRGMSPDEIQSVIESKPLSGMDRWLGSWCKRDKV
jgi:hypothetical protein